MPDKTPNHELNLYEEGDENWTHTPDMETIDQRLVVRDREDDRDEYTPYKDALFFATDTGTVYVGNETSWTYVGTIGESTPNIDGISVNRNHVGPFHDGEYHVEEGERWGVAFKAEPGLTIHSAVLDVNLSTADLDTVTIELWQVDNRTDHVIETSNSPVTTATSDRLQDGPNRVKLGFTIPDDEHDEYYLTIRPEADANGNELEFRRIAEWSGWDDWSVDDQGISFLQGGRMDNRTDTEWSSCYYYLFDLEIGEGSMGVASPWSHDVDEIYMRPRDPEEEFDNISPRALWIDTS